jgi:hypothetical protein
MDRDPRDPRYAERDPGQVRDASDVVEGDVGEGAHLIDPAATEALSPDLEALPAIDDKEPPDSVDERRQGNDAS